MDVPAISMGDYEIRIEGDEMHVAGPNEGLCRLLGQRFLELIGTEEGRNVLYDSVARMRLWDSIATPNASAGRPATEKQKQFARAIGMVLADNISFAEISFLLDEFEQVRWYVYFVFRQLYGQTPSEAGTPSDLITLLTMSLLNDRILSARILALQAMRNATGEEVPTQGEVYMSVALEIRKRWR